MHTENFGAYRIFLSDRSDGSFFLDRRLPVFSDWVVPSQVHKNEIVSIGTRDEIQTVDLTQADGIISCLTDQIFGVKLADCNGVILLGATWYAVVHAGWRGLQSGIIERAIRMLREHGEEAENLSVFCSPSIRVCCYEVGDEFLEYFPNHCNRQANGRYHFDAISYIEDILARNGIPKNHTKISPECTCCDTHYYSYRRDHDENRIVFGVEKVR